MGVRESMRRRSKSSKRSLFDEHKRKLREIALDKEAVDAVMPKGFAQGITPAKEEYDRHCLTRLSFRRWCPHRVQATKKNVFPTRRRS